MKRLSIVMVCFSLLATNAYAEFLPAKNLFNAPIADPRWPKFSMGVAHDTKASLGKRIWNFSFGENIAIGEWGDEINPWEFSVQPAAFGVMDITHKPTKLVNSDFFVGLGLSHLQGNMQYMFQLSHLSSHVGDEYLLNTSIQRVNLSYETATMFVRYKNREYGSTGISPYASIGYILHIDPKPMKRILLTAGLDWLSNKKMFNETTRFVLGTDVRAWKQNNYKKTLTVRGGLQFEKVKFCNRYLQLLVEYQRGKCLHGQFHTRNVNSIGLVIAYTA